MIGSNPSFTESKVKTFLLESYFTLFHSEIKRIMAKDSSAVVDIVQTYID